MATTNNILTAVAEATSPYLFEPDYGKNFQVVEILAENPKQYAGAFKYLRERIKNDNPEVSLLGLALLETLIKNLPGCHEHLADEYFMKGLVKVATNTRQGGVFSSFKSLGGTSVVGSEAALKIQIREKALLIIKMAATTYANGSKHPIFKQTYDKLKYDNVRFPEETNNESDMLMVGQFSKPKSPVPPPAVKKVAYQPPVDPSTVDVLSVPIPVENLVNQELVAAQETSLLLYQMMCSNANDLSNELVQAVHNETKHKQNAIVHIFNTTDEELLNLALAVNDVVSHILLGYEQCCKGLMVPIRDETFIIEEEVGNNNVEEISEQKSSKKKKKKKKNKDKEKDLAHIEGDVILSPPSKDGFGVNKRKPERAAKSIAEPEKPRESIDSLLFDLSQFQPTKRTPQTTNEPKADPSISLTATSDPFAQASNTKTQDPWSMSFQPTPAQPPVADMKPNAAAFDPFSQADNFFSKPVASSTTQPQQSYSKVQVKSSADPFSDLTAFDPPPTTNFNPFESQLMTTQTTNPFPAAQPYVRQNTQPVPQFTTGQQPQPNYNFGAAPVTRSNTFHVGQLQNTFTQPAQNTFTQPAQNTFTQPIQNTFTHQPQNNFAQPQNPFYNAQPPPSQNTTMFNQKSPQNDPFQNLNSSNKREPTTSQKKEQQADPFANLQW